MIHLVGSARNAATVKINLTNSGAGKHVSREPRLLTLANEVLGGMDLNGQHVAITHDMGRAIGYDLVVETDDSSVVFYAQLMKETAFTPFVKKGDPASTNLLTIALEYCKEDECYFIDDIWLGAFRPALPGAKAESSASKDFWQKHAYIFWDQPIRTSTITRDCPY